MGGVWDSGGRLPPLLPARILLKVRIEIEVYI